MPVANEETVYNFTVDKDHDYFVGEIGFLVHNANCPCIPGLVNGDSPLQQALRLESANSPFTPEGWLTDLAIQGSQMIIGPGGIGNPGIPGGFGKYSTPTFQSPSGDFQVHFYKNPQTGEVLYNDYKAVFNSQCPTIYK